MQQYVHNVKSFPSHKAERVELISISLAVSHTPVYTDRQTWGRCIAWCACLRPSYCC